MNRNDEVKYTYKLPIRNTRPSAILKLIELVHNHAEFSAREVKGSWVMTRWSDSIVVGFRLRDDQRFFKRTFWERNEAEIHQHGLTAFSHTLPRPSHPGEDEGLVRLRERLRR